MRRHGAAFPVWSARKSWSTRLPPGHSRRRPCAARRREGFRVPAPSSRSTRLCPTRAGGPRGRSAPSHLG